MGTKISYIKLIHDEGYDSDLLWYVNKVLQGKDMRAVALMDAKSLTERIEDAITTPTINRK